MAKYWLWFISVFTIISDCNGISRWDIFSTKTKYEWSHSSTVNTDDYFAFTKGSKSCRAIHINMVTRHGSRWPSEGDMEDIKEVHERIIASKSSNVYLALNSWTPRYDESHEKQLTVEGQKEQEDLGARIGLQLKALLANNGQYIKYVSSSKARTKDSNKFFHKGLLTSVQSLTEYTNEVNDSLMRSYDDCDNYEETVESDDNLEELIKFSKSLIFANISASVKERLGISFTPSDDDIILINELCAYEKAIFNEESVWCELLTDNERTILEYRSDIEKYFELSYGNRINSKISCPLLRDMFHTMDKAINVGWNYSNIRDDANNGYLAGKFYNGHSDTLIPLMTSLELFKDDVDLLLSNMDALQNRKFKTSKICPLSANLAFVLYVCEDTNNTNTTDRSFMVKLFVNEQPIAIPACKDDTCVYDTVRQYYSDIIDKCDLESLCDDDDCDDDTCGAGNIFPSLIFLFLSALISKLL